MKFLPLISNTPFFDTEEGSIFSKIFYILSRTTKNHVPKYVFLFFFDFVLYETSCTESLENLTVDKSEKILRT